MNHFNPYNVLRVGLQDHFLNLAPLFRLDGFYGAFTSSFGFSRLFSLNVWKTIQHLDVPLDYSSKNGSLKLHKKYAIKNPDFIPQSSGFNEPSSSKSFAKSEFKSIEPKTNNTLRSTYLHNTKVSTAFSSLDDNQTTSTIMTQLCVTSTETFAKATYHQ